MIITTYTVYRVLKNFFMGEMEFSMELQADMDKLIAISTDHENFKRFFPAQITDIKIINKNEEKIILFTVKHTVKNQNKGCHLHKNKGLITKKKGIKFLIG